jgi:hypothetical protein
LQVAKLSKVFMTISVRTLGKMLCRVLHFCLVMLSAIMQIVVMMNVIKTFLLSVVELSVIFVQLSVF